MAEAVDAIIADLSVRYQQYVTGFDAASAAHKRFTDSVPSKSGFGAAFSPAEVEQYANRHKKALNDVSDAAEQTADRVQKSGKKTSDADKAAAASAKAAAKDRADAAKVAAAAEKAAAKEAADAAKATAQAERDLQIALARVREGEINDVRKYRAELARLKQDEKEAANQAKANAFLTSPRTANGVEPLPAALPRSSRAEMRDVFKQLPREDTVSKAVIADPNEIDREAASLVRLANIQKTIDEQEARRTSRSGPLNGTGNNDAPGRPTFIPASYLNGADAAPEVAAAKEVDALTADIATKQAGLVALKGAEKREQQDILSNMRLEKQLRAAGIDEEEILLRLETQRAAVAAERAAQAKKESLSGVAKFAEGAGVGRGGGAALVGGLVAASVAGGVYSAAKEGLDYANNLAILSKQLGLTTRDLQVYQTAAEALGVTNEQLRTSFGQLSTNIGKAQEGAKEQGKIFGKDGLAIDLGNAKDGYKSLGDLLPTIVDRFSKIQDPARRAALETALFGESGRKLDSLLSGGTGAITALGDELERTGAILSGEDIARSAKVAEDLKRVGDQLERELASTVSQNAAAISSLAKSLLEGATALLHFIDAFQRFRAQGQINSGDAGLAATGRQTLNQTPEGRAIARRQNDDALRALREGARSNAAVLSVAPDVGDASDLLGRSVVTNTAAGRAAARKQILAQRRAIIQAENSAAAQNAGADASAQAGAPGNLNVFAPDPKKGPKGKSAESIEADRLEREKRFTAAEAQEQLARLGFLSDLTSDTRLQDQYARERIDIETTAKNAETRAQAEATINRQKLKGDAATLERTRAEQLVSENDANAELAKQVINRHELSRFLEEQLVHAQTASAILVDGLNTQLELAKTVKDRVALEKRLLAIQIENERLALQKQIDDKATSPAARADAQASLNALPGKQANGNARIDYQNRNPIQRYRDSLDDPQTAVQQAVAEKLKNVDDAITNAAAKVLGVKDPFLKSLLQIFLQQNVLKPLYDALSNVKTGGGGIGGLFGTILSAVSLATGSGLGGIGAGGTDLSFAANGASTLGGVSTSVSDFLPHFAAGGSGTIGGLPGIDQNTLSLNGKPVAKVGAGELLSISPNVAASNRTVQAAQPQITVVAPRHYDLSNSLIDRDTLAQMNAENRAYADAVGKAAVQYSVGPGYAGVRRDESGRN